MANVIFGDFEWDNAKAQSNLAKHGVSFEEASTVFLDLHYLLRPDESGTDRFVALGLSMRARILLVVHVERGAQVRIISARMATRAERDNYERRKT